MSASIGFELVALLAIASTSALAQTPEEPPPVFSQLGYDEAVARTKSGDKILVVKATAAWCAPCKMMDRTTWRDEKVVAWFKDNGLAIHFDVDQERELAKKLAIEAMPTMIAFVKGQEFDRIVGAKNAVEFLAWIEGVKRGEHSIDGVRARAKRATAGSEEEVDARYDLAKALVQQGELAQATEEYAWVWVHSKNAPGYGGVRSSFMATDIERLATRHKPARERFARFRDEAGAQLEGEKIDRDALNEWIVLNQVVGETDKTLEWFDRVKADAKWLPLIRTASTRIARVLESHQRWADIAGLYPDPLAKLRSDHELLVTMQAGLSSEADQDRQREMRAINEGLFRSNCGKLYACLLAAGKDAQAKQIADEGIKLDDTSAMRIALVQWGLTAEQPRAEQVALLDDAEKRGEAKSVAKLRAKLEQALAPKTEH